VAFTSVKFYRNFSPVFFSYVFWLEAVLSSGMSNSNCASCSKTKAPLTCGICNDSICKKCTQFVDADHFSFFRGLPDFLKHTSYCPTCFIQKVEPEMQRYEGLMTAAKNTIVFMKAQNKETRNIKRLEDPVRVVDCPDYDETVLRLAFFAAARKFNAIIDVDITSRKIIDGAYQTTVFSGIGIPTDVREDKLIKDRTNW
jgi:hypothetical protein